MSNSQETPTPCTEDEFRLAYDFVLFCYRAHADLMETEHLYVMHPRLGRCCVLFESSQFRVVNQKHVFVVNLDQLPLRVQHVKISDLPRPARPITTANYYEGPMAVSGPNFTRHVLRSMIATVTEAIASDSLEL